MQTQNKEKIRSVAMKEFINAILNTSETETVIAYFSDGTSETYTKAILDLLKTDVCVTAIVDGETGEIIFEK